MANAVAKKKTEKGKVSANKLSLLVTIVDKQKGVFYADSLSSFEVNFQMTVQGRGTATGQILDLLGLENNEKTVILSVVKEGRVPEILAFLQEKFKTVKNGKGIAYTVPFTSVIGTAAFAFLSNNKLASKGE